MNIKYNTLCDKKFLIRVLTAVGILPLSFLISTSLYADGLLAPNVISPAKISTTFKQRNSIVDTVNKFKKSERNSMSSVSGKIYQTKANNFYADGEYATRNDTNDIPFSGIAFDVKGVKINGNSLSWDYRKKGSSRWSNFGKGVRATLSLPRTTSNAYYDVRLRARAGKISYKTVDSMKITIGGVIQ